MKKITFKPPYRVGRKTGTAVLDSNGNLVVNFQDEEKAQEYVQFLNMKYRTDEVMDWFNIRKLEGTENVDRIFPIHVPIMRDKIKLEGLSILHTKHPHPSVNLPYILPSFEKHGKSNFLMDEVGQFERRDKDGNIIPWYIVDHVNLIKDPVVKSNAENSLVKDSVEEFLGKVAKEFEIKDSCCDDDNPCVCSTFSPNMASPDDVRDFLDNRKVKYTGGDLLKFPILYKLRVKMSNLIPKKKKKR